MPAILFVCTANQFRSPIAAAYFSQRLTATGSAETWKVSSAGIWTPPGLPAHAEAIKAAAKIGLDLNNHRTAEVDAELIKNHDLIVVMESGQKEALEIEFPDAAKKIVLLGKLAKVPGGEIIDPAKSKFADADETVSLLTAAVQRVFPKLVQFAMLIHDGFSPISD